MQATIRSLRIHYIYRPGTRETVLFLHGWGAPMNLYQPIFDLLQSLGYGVAAFDMPGVGQTEEPKAPLTLSDYVDFTLEFCRMLELCQQPVILMCHSNGGRIALQLLSDPQCPLRCEKAVLIDAAGIPLPKSAAVRLKNKGYHLLKKLGTGKLTQPLFGDLYDEMRDRRASADYKAASPVMRQTMNNLLPVDFREKLPQIHAQVLLIYGENDTATPPECGRILEQGIPNGGLALIQGAGHFSYADNWPQFSAVLRAFL